MLSKSKIENDIVWLENSIILAERQMASRLRKHIAEQEALIERMRRFLVMLANGGSLDPNNDCIKARALLDELDGRKG